MARACLLPLLALPLSACSVISMTPTLELFKATGSATTYALAGIPARASNTIHHPHPRPESVCIAYNPTVASAEVIPALQTALLDQRVSSRVYEGLVTPGSCPVWLAYAVTLDWGVPPWANEPHLFVAQATLTLRTSDGSVLASSRYQPGGSFELGKWASVPDLISPVVQALINGLDS